MQHDHGRSPPGRGTAQRLKAMTTAGSSWPLTWWGYLDLSHGPLPYQGVGVLALLAALPLWPGHTSLCVSRLPRSVLRWPCDTQRSRAVVWLSL